MLDFVLILWNCGLTPFNLATMCYQLLPYATLQTSPGFTILVVQMYQGLRFECIKRGDAGRGPMSENGVVFGGKLFQYLQSALF